MTEVKTYSAFGFKIECYKLDHGWPHPYPWRYRVIQHDRTWNYYGIPNQCHSALSAFRKAWWKCKAFTEKDGET